MLNGVFDKGLVLFRRPDAFENFARPYKVQDLPGDAADAAGNVISMELGTGFHDDFLEGLLDRYYQSFRNKVAGDCIGGHLPVDNLQEAVTVWR